MNGYDVAKKMLLNGWECVPLNQYKTPAVAFKDIEITTNFIERNKEFYFNTRILGVLTRGVWCIDIDVGHKESENGYKSLFPLPYFDELDENVKKGMFQQTPSGGMHLIFKKKAGIEYRQKIGYLDGVDIKAHENNYFVLAGSRTLKGMYRNNLQDPLEYVGEFENRIFGSAGNYEEQTREKYSARSIIERTNPALYQYLFSDRPVSTGAGGRGKQAYERIIQGISEQRNNDLFLAVSYAKACSVPIEPLRILIGDIQNGDEFTEEEWLATVNSAK